MKLLILVFLVGYASASLFDDALEQAADELVQEYINTPALKRSIAWADGDDDIQTELAKKLREALQKILEKVKDAIEHGKVVHKDLLEKLKELREKMKDEKINIGNKAKELFEKIKDKAKDFLRKLLENLGGGEETKEFSPVQHVEVIRNLFKKLKDLVLSKIDKEVLKAKIEEYFGKGSEMADELLRMLKEKGEHHKNKLLEFIDKILGEKETEKRSLKELWEKIKDYFKDLNIDLKEKFSKFGDYVKEKLSNVLTKGKDKMENIKSIAREFVKHTKDISKEVAAEGLEFMRPYKEDLGQLWDQFKDAVKEIMNRKE